MTNRHIWPEEDDEHSKNQKFSCPKNLGHPFSSPYDANIPHDGSHTPSPVHVARTYCSSLPPRP